MFLLQNTALDNEARRPDVSHALRGGLPTGRQVHYEVGDGRIQRRTPISHDTWLHAGVVKAEGVTPRRRRDVPSSGGIWGWHDVMGPTCPGLPSGYRTSRRPHGTGSWAGRDPPPFGCLPMGPRVPVPSSFRKSDVAHDCPGRGPLVILFGTPSCPAVPHNYHFFSSFFRGRHEAFAPRPSLTHTTAHAGSLVARRRGGLCGVSPDFGGNWERPLLAPPPQAQPTKKVMADACGEVFLAATRSTKAQIGLRLFCEAGWGKSREGACGRRDRRTSCGCPFVKAQSS